MRLQTFVSPSSVGATASFVIGAVLWAAGPTEAKQPAADVTKVSVEAPVEATIGKTSRAGKASLVGARPAAIIEHQALNNPTVKPGEVCWHSSFAEACEASARTHKPVLLFQLLGKLDYQFC
jgi:hypothetical protein